jgi:hypothetical protein
MSVSYTLRPLYFPYSIALYPLNARLRGPQSEEKITAFASNQLPISMIVAKFKRQDNNLV